MDDTITVTKAAELRGVHPDTIRNWIRKGWIKNRRREGRVWLMSKAEVLAFTPPRRGWPAEVPRCPKCGVALDQGHACDPNQAARWQGRRKGGDDEPTESG